MIDWTKYPNFSREVDFPDHEPQKVALDMLQSARTIAGIPFVITSGVRPGDPRGHGEGYGFDIRAHSGRARYKIVFALWVAGFTRIGVYDRHIHADCDPDLPTEVLWPGKSR